MPTRDPDELRARAAQLLEESIAAAERGDVAKADELILLGRTFMRAAELAEEIRSGDVHSESTSDDDIVMTDAEGNVTAFQVKTFQRRGQAVAKAKAEGSPVLEAISHSKWRSARNYAPKRLHVSPASFSNYVNGVTPCPKSVALKVQNDFDLPADKSTWPAGVVE